MERQFNPLDDGSIDLQSGNGEKNRVRGPIGSGVFFVAADHPVGPGAIHTNGCRPENGFKKRTFLGCGIDQTDNACVSSRSNADSSFDTGRSVRRTVDLQNRLDSDNSIATPVFGFNK